MKTACRKGAREGAALVHSLEEYPFWVPECWERVGVAGMTRRGKSAWLKAWIQYLMRELPKVDPSWGVVVFDVHDEHSRQGREREDCKLGCLPERLTVSAFLDALEQDDLVLLRERLFLAVVPEDPDLKPADVAAQALAIGPKLRDRGKLVVVWEELGYWAECADAVRVLHASAACWGKEGIVPVFSGQAIVDTPECVRKQWSRLVTAQQVKRSDVSFIRQQCGKAVAREVTQLPRLHYVTSDLTQPSPELLAELT